MKKWLVIAIIALLIILFVFPKDAGKTGSSGLQPGEQSWKDKECSCFGYKFSPGLAETDSPSMHLCFGIPFSCKCIQYTYNIETENKTSKEIEC